MSRSRRLVVIVGVIAFLSVAHRTLAFTTHPVDLTPAPSDSPADAGQLSDKTTNGQSGGTSLRLPEGLRFQFTAPPSNNRPNSPFVDFPSTVFVPSEYR
jgi:hypothetical protein